jgi:mono/diheme cytochrome c family protein
MRGRSDAMRRRTGRSSRRDGRTGTAALVAGDAIGDGGGIAPRRDPAAALRRDATGRAGMLKKLVVGLFGLAAAGAAVAWVVTEPRGLVDLPKHTPDVAKGEALFWAAGCSGCHAARKSEGEERLKLAGGTAFKTDFGTFYSPNISSDATYGIGAWSVLDLVNALKFGVSPKNAHYYPALPYTSYARMKTEDVMDLAAFVKTLPAVAAPSKPHDVGFPFNIRRAMGGWKTLFYSARPVIDVATASPEVQRGAYLVEGPGHCGECHTERNPIGGLYLGKWLGGAKNPDGDGRIPNITPGGEIKDWSAADIADYLGSGITPDGDVVGGSMTEVVANLGHLPKEDLAAIAAYLKFVPAVTVPAR